MVKVLEAYKKFHKIGLKENPFQERELTPNEEHLFAGRAKEIDEIMSIMGERKNIHIYGKKGIGKSTVLNYLMGQVKKEKIITIKLEAPPTSKRQFYFSLLQNLFDNNKIEENSDLDKYLKKIEAYSKAPVPYPARIVLDDLKHVYTQYFKQVDFPLVIFIDNFDKVFTQTGTVGIDYITALTNIMFDKEYFVFITAGFIGTIKEEYIDPIKKALDDRLEIKYALPDFELEDTIELIDKRLEYARLPGSNFSFSKQAIQAIHEYSQTPREIISICDGALRYALDGKKITPKTIKQVCATKGFTHSQRVKATLREKPQLVYDKLFELGRQASPTELSKIMNTPASTICYNLEILRANGLVKKIGGGNRVKYVVDLTEEMKPIIKSTVVQQHIQTGSGEPVILSGISVSGQGGEDKKKLEVKVSNSKQEKKQ